MALDALDQISGVAMGGADSGLARAGQSQTSGNKKRVSPAGSDPLSCFRDKLAQDRATPVLAWRDCASEERSMRFDCARM
jgi:hypothetical protein